RDGKLDLFVCCYVQWSPAYDLSLNSDKFGVGRVYPGPDKYHGTQCLLYHNEGNGKFKNVTEQAGINVLDQGKPVGKSLGVIACDVDDDGWPDLLVANDTIRNYYFHNKGDGTFEEVGISKGLGYAEGRARGGMGIDFGEFRPGNFAAIICN